jgi:hypothetical protein
MSSSNLIIKIEYKDYISLSDFKESIEGWNNQYNLFVSRCYNDGKNDKLLVKEIKQGSIIIELASAIIPLISNFNTVYDFFASTKHLFSWLSSKQGIKPEINVSDLDNTRKIITPVNHHNDRQITISIAGDNNAPIIINAATAQALERNANEEYDILNKRIEISEDQENKENVIFKLTQIKDDENPNKNTKGIIPEIDNKEHLVVFSSVETKELILRENTNPFLKNYLVDIKINKINDSIKSYTILTLKDTYIDEDEPDLFSNFP